MSEDCPVCGTKFVHKGSAQMRIDGLLLDLAALLGLRCTVTTEGILSAAKARIASEREVEHG